MSRDQRRANRKQQARAGGSGAGARAVNRRTPVRAPGASGPPWTMIGIVGGVALVIALIAYLIIQAASGEEGISEDVKAEQDSSPDLPGVFYPSQGRSHFNYSPSPDRVPRPFCEGVRASEEASAGTTATTTATVTSTPTNTPTQTPTPVPTGTAAGGTPGTSTPSATATVPTDCYASNPPSSGQHIAAFRNVDLGNGARINIPADPDVYPDDVVMPRETIPHILEHAGVFVGYNCATGDAACEEVVDDLERLVNDRIDNHNNRVVMARSTDLPVGEIGLSSWTRALNMTYQEYDEDAVEDFIGTHSCRFDPEGFC